MVACPCSPRTTSEGAYQKFKVILDFEVSTKPGLSENVLKKSQTNEHNKFKSWPLSQSILQISYVNPTGPVTTAHCRSYQGKNDINKGDYRDFNVKL